MKLKNTIALTALVLLPIVASAQLRISEFMASNSQTLADEDGSFEDWIEIQNISATNVNLLDWSLTDNAGKLDKWRFPATNLAPSQFLIVFASNKDRDTAGQPLHTNFKLDASGEYLALVDPFTNIVTQFSPAYPPQVADVSFGFAVTSSNILLVSTGATAQVLVPSVANGGAALNYSWTGGAEPFNASAWTTGVSGAGFGAGEPGEIGLNLQTAMFNQNPAAFMRLEFDVSNPTNFSELQLRLKYDDGFVAWLNGREFARANAPIEDLNWDSSATASHSAAAFESISVAAGNFLHSGKNILAIQGLNLTAGDGSFLILPELTGVTVAGETASGLYFTTPTPGAENLGGATAPGPGIADVKHTPNVPLDNENLFVTAKVFPTAHPIASVLLHYRVMFDSEIAVNMFDDGAHGDGVAGDGIYGGIISASLSTVGQMVRYYVTAQDTSAVISRGPVFNNPASTAQYLGTVVQPGYVTSRLPVVHLFAPASVLQPGPVTAQTGADSEAGGRVALFFDGEFYDNIQMQLRGNSTANFAKKSHRLEFNKEHPFRYLDSARRIRKTSFLADYPDPTYLRQGLSFWLCDQVGVPAPFYMPMRLQLNGSFYQLANHTDVQGEEMLERFGFDPNGAYYANAGIIVPGKYSTGGFEKKTRKTEDDTDYIALANAISESLPAGQRMTNLFDYLDVPEVINYMAVARLSHQNDDVWADMALYHDNDGDNLWRIMPYDMNLSWGAAYMDASAYGGMQVTNDNLKSFPLYGSSQALPDGSGNWNRLYDVIFQSPQTREMVLRRMRTLLDQYFKPPGTLPGNLPIEQEALAWRDLIGPDAQLDRAFWGWPGKGGQCNFDPGIGVTNGVDQFINLFMFNRRNHFYVKHSITNLSLPIGITKSSNAGIPLAQPAHAVISIAGWDYNPTSGNQDEEYLQLTNSNNFAVDLSGWKLDGGVHFTFPGGTVLPANSSLYLSPNVRAFRARSVNPRGGQGRFVIGPYNGHLNAWGETFTLTDRTGWLVSSNSFTGNPSAVQRYLRITEIMYNPAPAPAINADAQQFEYVELKNISSNVILDLNGVQFSDGIAFHFTGSVVTSLLPGQCVLIVRNIAAFAARYGGGFNIAGTFTGALDNGGEALRLDDAAGEKVLEFAYHDAWYPITDGFGFSLVIVDENAPWQTWDEKSDWRASGNVNGSPGVIDPGPPTFCPVFINEVLTHTDLPQLDSVELFNPATNTANIGGWFLTDDFQTPKKYRIPTDTSIPPGGYLVINETQFNTGPNAFRLSELGEDIYLFSADANTNLTGYFQGYSFPAAPNGVSFGRHSNSLGEVDLVLQSAVTLGGSNAYPRVGPVVISEIMYHPPDTNGTDNALDEFIELQNSSATNVPLYDPLATTNTWHLRNAIEFDFPSGQSLLSGARCLVVGFDPTNTVQLLAFRTRYGVSNNVPVYGPWRGKLDNSGETIELQQPGAPDDTAIVPFYLIDKVAYRDDSPWPSGADGIGNSLQRISNTGYGNDPTNWFAAGISAGRATVPNLAPTVTIVSPTNTAVVFSESNINIFVSAADPDGSLALVQLFSDGAELARWSGGSSNYLWSGATSGTHLIEAHALDNLGAIAVSAMNSVTVKASPPSVSILYPTNGTVLVSETPTVLSANTRSGGGAAAGVDFFLDGALIGSAAASFNLSWTANPPGYHTLSAVAYDAEGQASQEEAVSIFVQAGSFNPVLINSDADWRYLDNGSDQGSGWIAPGFNDSAWSTGPAKFGFNGNGNSGIATLLNYGPNSQNKYTTYYFRRQLIVPTLAGMTNLYLEVQRDDGVAVYLNGVSLYRNNLPTGTLSYSQLATNATDQGNNWQTAILPLGVLQSGTNFIAAEVHQSSLGSSDLGFNLRLTLLGSSLGPAVMQQPSAKSVSEGGTAEFAISAAGTGPLFYQWQLNGTNLTGATNSSLSLSAVSLNDAGFYRVVVSNSVGTAASLEAGLTVLPPDTDGDGLPDDWEMANGTNPLVNDSDADPDQDRFTNRQEFLAGTNPTNAASRLAFESSVLLGTNLVFSFNAISNRSYTVQFQSALGGTWEKWRDVLLAPSNRMIWMTNQNSASGSGFYRLLTPSQP